MKTLSPSLAFLCLIAWLPAVAGVNSWTLRGPPGGNATSIAFHPTQPDIVLAQTWGGLYRSTDGGSTWSMPVANDIGAIGSIVFDPTQAGRVFLGSDTLYRSNDSGLSFTRLTSPSTRYANDMAVASDGTLYMADQGGRVFRSENQGAQWTEITGSWTGLQNSPIPDLIVDPNDPNRLYVSVPTMGLFRSENRGTTWVAPAANSPGNGLVGRGYISSIAVMPGNSDRLMVATQEGFFVSANRGGTWTSNGGFFEAYGYVAFDPAAPANGVAVSTTGKVQRSSDSGATWPSTPTELRVNYLNGGAFRPGTAGHLFLGTTDGPMLSTDGGVEFAPRFTGIRGGKVAGFASADDGTLYSAYEFGPMGVFRRQGDNWLPLDNDELRASIDWSRTPIDIATAASDSSLIYVITSNSQVVRSTDAGVSWSTAAPELLGASPQNVDVDPANADVAYASTYSGLWKTINRGLTWNRIGLSLPDRVEAIGIDPANTLIVYAIGYATDGTLLGIFKSLDGGVNWAPTGATRPGQILGFTFNPADTQTLYAYSGFDVLKTTDGGANWTQLDFGPPAGTYTRAMAVLIDPVIPSTVFVVSSPSQPGFLRSVDSGATWERFAFSVPQGEFLFLDEAALDPMQPSRLHVGVTDLGIADYEVAPDLEVTLQGLDSALPVLGSRVVRVRARNLSAFASSASEIQVTLPDFLTTNVPNGCSLAMSVLRCRLTALLAQATQEIEFTVTAGATPATGNVGATIEGHEGDPVASNNQVVAATTVSRANVAAPPSGTGGSGGGGGSLGWLAVALLGLLLVRRKWGHSTWSQTQLLAKGSRGP